MGSSESGFEYRRFGSRVRSVAGAHGVRSTLHLLFCIAVVLGVVAPASAGVFYRPTLGREPLPAEDSSERSQAGRLEVGRFIPTGVGAAAARPDASSTGAALYRLSMLDAFSGNGGILGDVVSVTDRDRPRSLYPTQLSYLLGVGTRNGPWRIQFDREEHLPLDRSGGSYRYWDVRVGATFEAELSGLKPFGNRKRRPGPRNQVTHSKGATLRGEFGIGYFLHNKSFHTRMDQTGQAFLRYEARGLLSAPGGGLRLKLDADFLTDRYRHKWSPANMDLTVGVGVAS